MGKEPDLSKLAKTLTSKRLECTDEIKVLMDCMMRQGILEADTGCQRQATAAIICLQTATKASSARKELGRRLEVVTRMFRRHGFR
ncbi:hypothetical protein OEZ86_007379 [Tetradesmus obliquus]|uniref:Uncharacterized protein n=2 Tax=Tetradesmus obliquus TaxID=3088 RepID=A0ABY8U375_TETOB|nr:hypothetical protein OEZ85_012595 [Tetradesmus obliquus]WIA36016.1 hypothetical protein OEZ86_007379 [Tetradesmus obliquus]